MSFIAFAVRVSFNNWDVLCAFRLSLRISFFVYHDDCNSSEVFGCVMIRVDTSPNVKRLLFDLIAGGYVDFEKRFTVEICGSALV